LEGLAPSHEVQAISGKVCSISESRYRGPPRQLMCLFGSEGCLLKQTSVTAGFSACVTSTRDRPNAVLDPDWQLLHHGSRSNDGSDEMLTQTDVGYWHL
jgi:hypothetical protein